MFDDYDREIRNVAAFYAFGWVLLIRPVLVGKKDKERTVC